MQKIVEEIKEIIQEVSGLDSEEIESDCNLFSLGLDSLMLVQIKKQIDRKYGIELPIGRMMNDMDTITKVVNFIEGVAIKEALPEEKNTDSQSMVYQKKANYIAGHVSDCEMETVNPAVLPIEAKKEQTVIVEEIIQQPKEELLEEKGTDDFLIVEKPRTTQRSDGLAELMEMQMRLLADSLQGLAVKQLETFTRLNLDTTKKTQSMKMQTNHAEKSSMAQETRQNTVETSKQESLDRNTRNNIPQINFRAVKLEHDKFTPQQKAFIEAFIASYNQKTRKSKAYADRHREHFCDWITTLNFRMDFKQLIYPIVTDHSQGARFWDLDGNCYLDMAIGYGVHYFGHRPKFIVDALQEQIAKGYETGPQTALGGEVAELIGKITGCERVAFANTGSEAVMASLRIARTVTKRPKVVMFRGAYHGNFDCVLAESDGEGTFPISPGTMPGMVEDVIVLEYGTEESLQMIKERAEEIAAVIVEPVQSRNPSLQPKAFLKELRQITKDAGTALIFDEMITGFRICPGGCQEYFGIQADMATYGKIIGGGLPIGVVAGKAEYLDAVDGGVWSYDDNSYPDKEMTYFAGTFCKHPLSLAASRAVLRFIEKDGGEVQRRVNRLTDYFVREINSCFMEQKVPLKVTSFGSEFRFEPYGRYDFESMQVEMELFFYLLMEQGIYIWERRTCFFSAAHTFDDAQIFLNTVKEAITRLRAGGFAFTFKESNRKSATDLRKFQKKKCFPKIGSREAHKASQAQERYFLVSQFEEMEKGVHLPCAFLVQGKLQTERIEPIFQEIVNRHEALRSSYELSDGEVVQRIAETCSLKVEREDGEGKSLDDLLERFIVPFDLSKAPLFRVKLISLGEKGNLILTDIHHSIADGYSCTLIMKEFMERYLGKTDYDKPATYCEYLEAQDEYRQSEEYQEDVRYWKEELTDVNWKVTFPVNYQSESQVNAAGGSVVETIDLQTTSELKQFAKEQKCSLYQLLYSAFALLLSKMAGEQESTIGVPVDMRGDGQFDETIGMLTNTLVIKNNLSQDWSLAEYLEENRRQFAKAYVHRKIPYEEMVCELGHTSAAFEVMFVFENAEERVNKVANLVCQNLEVPVTDCFYDISLEVIECQGELKVQVYYKRQHYNELDAREILSCYGELLAEMMEDRGKPVKEYLSSYEEKWRHVRNETLLIEKQKEAKRETVNTRDSRLSMAVEDGDGTLQESIEEMLTAYWKRCFELDCIDREQNLFEMGAKSLDGIRLIDAWKKESEIAISLMDLFHYPTIASLSDVLAKRSHMVNEEEYTEVDAGEVFEKVVEPSVSCGVQSFRKQEEGRQMPIAIIGMAGRFPKADNVEEFWKNLSEGKECITFFEEEELMQEGVSVSDLERDDYVKAKGVLEDADCFDASFFGYTPTEVEKMDPQIRLFHQCAYHALEDAGYGPESTNAGGKQPLQAGVFAGGASNYTWMSQIYEPTDDVKKRMERISLNDKDYMSTRISYKLNLNGPSYGVQTACSTSLAAIHLACRSLEMGECKMALAGGVCVMLPQKTGYRYEEGMILSKDGHCRVFGEDATGTVFSDGVGAIVLKPLEHALRDGDAIYAVITGTGVNNDGNRKAGYTAPSIEGQAEVIKQAYHNARIQASTVTYVETHGTGTILGDPIEVEGLKAVFPIKEKPYCALGSLKSNCGHLDAAGGVAGVIKTALALKNKVIPATLNTDKPNPQLELEGSPFYLPQETIAWKQELDAEGYPIPRRAGVSAFGFGGTNVHLVMEETPARNESVDTGNEACENQQRVMVLSAKHRQELDILKEEMVHFLDKNPKVPLDSVESVLWLGRKAYSYREAYVVANVEEWKEVLRKKSATLKPCNAKRPQTAFLFTGQGSQYVNMARALYEKDTVFHQFMEEGFRLLEEKDYRAILYPDKADSDATNILNQTENAQVILFLVEYAMANYLMTIGVKPDILIGHSLGEYVAATVSGVFTLEEGLRFIKERARLMQSMEHGAMNMVLLAEKELMEALTKAQVSLSIAAVNGPEQCVVSGSFEEMERFEQYVTDKGVIWRRLQTSHAFHSPMMEGMLEEFGKVLSTISMKRPRIPIVSNLTGERIGEEITTPDYWMKHLRSTVRFYDGLSTILKKQTICIEVGPGKMLSTLVRKHEAKEQVVYNGNMIPHPKDQVDAKTYFMKMMGTLWCHGINIDYHIWQGEKRIQKIPLPGYPFAKQRFSMTVNRKKVIEDKDNSNKKQEEFLYRPYWKSKTLSGQTEEQKDYLVIGIEDSFTDMVGASLEDRGHHVKRMIWSDNWREEFVHVIKDEMEVCKSIFILYLMPYLMPTKETCFYNLVDLVKELDDSKLIHLSIVTKVPDAREHLENQLVTGISAGINKEYWNLSAKQIQLGDVAHPETLVKCLVKECESAFNLSLVRYENSLRLERDYEEIFLTEGKQSKLRQGGNYVITGASGGIGTCLAKYLEDKYQAHVLSIARKGDSSQQIWEADVTDYSVMEVAVCEFERKYGSITGVFHLAGSQGEGLLKERTSEQNHVVLSPKTEGTMVLEQVFQKRKLEFMVLFSSLSVITEDAGQFDYIAANAYMDAYANWASRQYPDRQTISINWDIWGEVGLAKRMLGENPNLMNKYSTGIQTKRGMELLERILASEESQVVVSGCNLEKCRNNLDERKESFARKMESTQVKYARPELSVLYQEPETDMERELVSLWEDAFSIEGIGIDDDFFELGGDSLYAVGMANTLKKKYQMDITDIYRCPTIRQLAKKLVSVEETLPERLAKVKMVLNDWESTNRGEAELKEEWETYRKLCEPYRECNLKEKKEFRNILLLGATGYIGIYLLREMLLTTRAHVIMIVRRTDEASGYQRIEKKLNTYFGAEFYQEYQERIHVLEGEITKSQFGLSREQYQELADKVECIVNASGKADHYGEWEAFYAANVAVVGHCIHLAKTKGAKEIHQLSTKGVGTGYAEGKKYGIFTEFNTDFYESGGNFYVESKQQAEKMLLEAREEGVKTVIYRVGDVVYDTADGHFQENIEKNALYLLMQAILRLDVLPKKLPAFLEFAYVDFASKTIVSIMNTKELENEIFHIMNPYPLTIEELEEPFEALGYHKEYKTIDEFFSYLSKVYDQEEKREAVQNFLTYTHLLEIPEYMDLVMTTGKTEIVLEKLGLTWVKPDASSVKMMIGYGENIHFF